MYVKRKRITHEEFVNIIREITDSEYEVLGEYINKNTRDKLKHSACGHEWEVIPKVFINEGTRCPKCSRKGINKGKPSEGRKPDSHDLFLSKVEKKFGKGQFEILDEYVNYLTKLTVKHECGYTWSISPSELLKRKTCPQCNRSRKKSHEEFIREINEISKGEYIVASEYKNVHSKVTLIHTKCNYRWNVKPTAFLHSGTRCPNCSGKIKRITSHETFLKEVEKRHKYNYTIVSEYISSKHDISFICEKHGLLKAKPQTFLTNGCGKCAYERRRKTHEEFLIELYGVHAESIMPIDTYVKLNVKIRFKCNNEHIWSARPNNILKGYGCPECSEFRSKGEAMISEFLKNRNIIYETQFAFKGCRNEKVLRFDFAILKDGFPKLLVEYDGKQHFKPVDFGSKGDDWAKNQLKIRIEHDQIKNDYCIKNNIPLIRIPYWETEVEYILDMLLKWFYQSDSSSFDLVERFVVNHERWRYNKYIDDPLKINNQMMLTK